MSGRPTAAGGSATKQETALIDGEIAFRQHAGGHTTGPNRPTFLNWAERYVKGPAASK